MSAQFFVPELSLGVKGITGTQNPQFAHNADREYGWVVARTDVSFRGNDTGVLRIERSDITKAHSFAVGFCYGAP